jgi:DNA-binding transcriptional LysR family regulator
MEDRIDLNRIATFVRVVQSGSFTAAAGTLSLPTSSVSRAVARLEDDLGTRLLHRTTRKLRLTEVGERYFERMKAVIGEVDEAHQALAADSEPRGTVRLTASVDLGLRELPALMAKLVMRHPHLVIDLILSDRRVDIVDEGVDLALRAGRTLDDSSLVARKLGAGDLGIFGATTYLERRGRPRTLADVAKHDCVMYRGRAGKLPWRLTGPRGDETVETSGPVMTDDMMFAYEAVVAGMGLGLVPAGMVAREAPARRPQRVLPSYGLQGAVYLVSPSRRLVPARVAVVRDFLIEELTKIF